MKEKIKQELDALDATLLHRIKADIDPSAVPPAYLKQLSEQVLQRVKAQEQLRAKERRLMPRFWVAAASILLLLGVTWFLTTSPTATTNTANETLAADQLEDVSSEDIATYVDDHLDDFDLLLFATLELEDDFSSLPEQDAALDSLEDDLNTGFDWLDDSDLF